MPGFLLHMGATVLCAHAGQAQPTVPNPRVKISGQATMQQPNPWTIAGCPFATAAGPMPCVTAQWTTAATQLTVQAALQEWLGDLVEIKDVTVDAVDSSLTTVVTYVIRRTQEQRVETFVREAS